MTNMALCTRKIRFINIKNMNQNKLKNLIRDAIWKLNCAGKVESDFCKNRDG